MVIIIKYNFFKNRTIILSINTITFLDNKNKIYTLNIIISYMVGSTNWSPVVPQSQCGRSPSQVGYVHSRCLGEPLPQIN